MICIKYTACAQNNAARHSAALDCRDYILNYAFGIKNPEDSILKTNRGKPYIEGADFDFSTAHTGSAAVAAVCGNGKKAQGIISIDERVNRIGVDIELEERQISGFAIKGISQRFFSEKERKYVAAGTEGERLRFLEIWTRKESIVKATGEGLSAMNMTDSFADDIKYLKTSHIVIENKKYILSVAGI